jgi:hypothetical protein
MLSLVPKLQSGNYRTWKTKMEMLLIREKLWGIVCQRRTRPEGGTEEKPTKAQTEFDDDAERATATIFLYLDEMAESHISSLRNPVVIWAKLEEIYQSSGFSARFGAWRRLFAVRFDSFANIEAYINEVRSYCQQLKEAGFEVNEEIQVSVVLNGLGSSWETFMMSVIQTYRQKEKVSLESLVSQLMDEERRKSDNEGDPVALLTRGRGSGLQRQPLKCWSCGRVGHREENCWDKHPEKRPGKGQDTAVESF